MNRKGHPSQNAAMNTNVTVKVSAIRLSSETGRRSRAANGTSAAMVARSSSGVGRSQVMGGRVSEEFARW